MNNPDKDTSVIPKGMYCHGRFVRNPDGSLSNPDMCPYWKFMKDRPEQENAWCDYLGKGDVEINQEVANEDCEVTSYDKGVEHKETKKYKEWGYPFCNVSLLWDQCKECGINDDFEDDEDD